MPANEASASFDFDAVYRAHATTVARWIARLGGPRVAVEDVLQEVFLVVSRRLADFRGDAKLTTWLFTITDQTIRNWRRRERWRRLVSRLTSRVEATTRASEPTPLEEVERRQAGERLYRVLDAMPEKQRTLLVLFEVERCSAAEIGELMGLQAGTVRVRLHRARADFLQRLRALEGDDASDGEEPT